MKRIVATGRTIEEAVTSALVRLGVTRSQATVRVIQEPSRGFLGLFGGRAAEVEVTVRLTPEEAGKEFLSELLRKMGIDAQVIARPDVDDSGETVVCLDIRCPEEVLPVVIGRHGSTLDAMQYLVNVVAHREQAEEGRKRAVRFVVDAGEYRRRRREGLYRMAERAAARATRTRRAVALDAMPAADRKLIHAYLQNRTDVTTMSEGVEPHRKVVVVPVAHDGAGASAGRSRPQRV